MMHQSLFVAAKTAFCFWVTEANSLRTRRFTPTSMVSFKTETVFYLFYLAHHGAITNVELHRTPGSTDFSRYCLTSSIDFTCKLWNLAVSYFMKQFYSSIVVLGLQKACLFTRQQTRRLCQRYFLVSSSSGYIHFFIIGWNIEFVEFER